MRFFSLLLAFVAATVDIGNVIAGTLPAPADTAWDTLRSRLSSSASLLADVGLADYFTECLPEIEKSYWERSSYNLIDQPSGLCMMHYYCAFLGCSPYYGTNMTPAESAYAVNSPDRDLPGYQGVVPAPAAGFDLRSQEPNNLPGAVLFPVVAGDVFAAVAFAKEHGIELSVKNSGHSFAGQSTKKGTLLLNMNRYEGYATNAGVVECSTEDAAAADKSDLGSQPCKLALARGKPAVIRVGGGENFDKLFRAVRAANTAGDTYKYHIVGGAAGTVSPMGWTWSGGLGGTTNGRTLGFGIDQVLQVEMVLPLGHHVRFGPTEWEDASAQGFVVPRTIKVEGQCNSNPQGSEDEWIWEPCADPIDFDGVWFSVNGGGGGTYGIVTSVYLQIHDYVPMTTFTFGSYPLTTACGIVADEAYGPLGDTVYSFLIDYITNPEEGSNLCSAPNNLLSHNMKCYGDGAQIMLSSWKIFLAAQNQTLIEAGVLPASIETAATCFDKSVSLKIDHTDELLKGGDKGHEGKASSYPLPSMGSSIDGFVSLLVPKIWVSNNKEEAITFLKSYAPYLAFGSGTANAHDQASSLSAAHRNAAMMLSGVPLTNLDESFWTDTFPKMYPNAQDGNFPAFAGANHLGPNVRGPLKEDWSKPCPQDWTDMERNEKCVSIQEAVWGTETLARLEAVKKAVDPNGMLNCYACVGNDYRLNSESPAPPLPWDDQTSGADPKPVDVKPNQATDSKPKPVDEELTGTDGDESSSTMMAIELKSTFLGIIILTGAIILSS